MKIIKYTLCYKSSRNEDFTRYDKTSIYSKNDNLSFLISFLSKKDSDIILDKFVYTINKNDSGFIYHNKEASLFRDLKNPEILYISSFCDEQDFYLTTKNIFFTEFLKNNNIECFIMKFTNFIDIIKKWNMELKNLQIYFLLYEQDNNIIDLQLFDTMEQAKKFIVDHTD